MNSNWRNRPTTIELVSKDIDYVISIDENGTGNLKKLLKAKNSCKPVPESEQHFAITACMIRSADFAAASEMVMDVKRRYWNNATFSYGDTPKRVCFHSKEIRGRKGAFHPDVIDYESFILDLTQLIEDLPMTIYASHIDKVRHANRYVRPDSPYDLCMNFVLERVMRDMSKPQKGDVVYCDPPYTHSQGIIYGAQDFHITRLWDKIAECKERGAYVMLSINGTRESQKKDISVDIPEGLFERELLVNCGTSMIDRLQNSGKEMANQVVHDKLLLTW